MLHLDGNRVNQELRTHGLLGMLQTWKITNNGD